MTTYRDAGVDIDAADAVKSRIRELAMSTFSDAAFVKAGFFCGGVKVPVMKEPVLMLSNDGVGTKMIVARMAGRYGSVGVDLVHACANDLVTCGAKPLFFLDYIASERVDGRVSVEIVSGIAKACRDLGIVLVGGETAQMPGVYVKGEVDVAGTVGGFVERSEVIDGSSIAEGDVLIGVASSGLHTNGYSLARKVLLEKFGLEEKVPALNETLADVLLEPHAEYVSLVLEMRGVLKGVAHITGGGLTDNVPRIIPEGLGTRIVLGSWDVLPVFSLIQSEGSVPMDGMLRAFNMGVGLVVAVGRESAARVLFDIRRKRKAWIIGEVVKGEGVEFVKG